MRWWPESWEARWRPLTARERRTVTVGAVLAAAIVAFWIFAPSTGGESPAAEGEANREALLARLRAIVEQGPAVQEAWARARQEQVALRGRLLPETNPNVAGAALSRHVQQAAEASQMRLDRTLVAPAREAEGEGEGLREVIVEVDLSGDIHGLREFLYRIESPPPLLAVENLRITSVEAPAPGRTSGAEPPLRAQMSVAGFLSPSPPQGASPGRPAGTPSGAGGAGTGVTPTQPGGARPDTGGTRPGGAQPGPARTRPDTGNARRRPGTPRPPPAGTRPDTSPPEEEEPPARPEGTGGPPEGSP